MDSDTLNLTSELATIVGGLIALLAALGAVLRYLNRKQSEQIIAHVMEATYPISPAANGGLSLPDVARRTELIERDVAQIKGQIDLLVRIYTEEDK